MRIHGLLLTVLLSLSGCAIGEEAPPNIERGSLALGTGSCEGSCGTISSSYSCWCDELCAKYGDCCSDVDDICLLDECMLTESGESKGCADDQVCVPGSCLLDCPEGDDSCCAPNSCIEIPQERLVARCSSDEYLVTVTELDDELTMTVLEADGTLAHEGTATMRVIENGNRITRIGYRTEDADLRIRTRDTRIPETEGTAHLRFSGNDLMQCDVY